MIFAESNFCLLVKMSLLWKPENYRSTHQRCSIKKAVLKNFADQHIYGGPAQNFVVKGKTQQGKLITKVNERILKWPTEKRAFTKIKPRKSEWWQDLPKNVPVKVWYNRRGFILFELWILLYERQNGSSWKTHTE